MIDIRIGNVIRDPNGYMWIVTNVHEQDGKGLIEAVAFDAENVSAGQKIEDHIRKDWCEGCEDPKTGEEHWEGKYHETKVKGWGKSKILAPNVKEFIMRKFKKVMDI